MSDTDRPAAVPLEGGLNPALDTGFSVARYDVTGFLWETRVPGTDAEETWDSGRHEHPRLCDAVRAAIPAPWVARLGLDDAARLALELELVIHTGVACVDADAGHGTAVEETRAEAG